MAILYDVYDNLGCILVPDCVKGKGTSVQAVRAGQDVSEVTEQERDVTG